MQPDERIGVAPVPTGGLPAVDQGDAYVGMIDQRIGECHAGGPGSHDQVVGFHCARHVSPKHGLSARERPSRITQSGRTP